MSALIKDAENNGKLSSIAVARRAPKVSHLFFADNSIIFGKAKVDDCQAILRILSDYAQVSGKVINFSKSLITFSPNVHDEVRDVILG